MTEGNEQEKEQEVAQQSTAIRSRELSDELAVDFLAYAEHVIKDRAIPDVRDGLKPVHRRILWAMWDMGCKHSSLHKKSARIVGDIIGKYHPHGDGAAYHAMARLAQPFVLSPTLVDGKGNFGDVDGNSPAAQRYTEARLEKFAEDVYFADIGYETVDFMSNYSGEFMEPCVLPARIPMYLLTASSGIAVGMATDVCPHNVTEVCEALITRIHDSSVSVDKLMNILRGPDFPLGGLLRTGQFSDYYRDGKGSFKYRVSADIENEGKAAAVVIKTIPYMANKSGIIETISKLVCEGKIEGISEVRDESTKAGIRVVVEIKKKYDPRTVLNTLYSLTELQQTVSMNCVAIVGDQPKRVGLVEVLDEFIAFRRRVVTRRCQFKKRKAEERKELVDGMLIAVIKSDEVIKIIKKAQDPLATLISKLGLTERQAEHVFNMPVRRFSTQDVTKLKEEQASLGVEIADQESVLADPAKMDQIIVDETVEIKSKYGRPRATLLVDDFSNITAKDTVKEQDVALIFLSDGTVKSTPIDEYRLQKRRGTGMSGVRVPDGIYPIYVARVSTHDDAMILTNKGNRHRIKVYDIPASDRMKKPKPISAYVSGYDDAERVVAVTKSALADEECLIMLTIKGMLKKLSAKTVNKSRDNTTRIYPSEKGGDVVAALVAKNDDEITLVTSQGKMIRMSLDRIREISSRSAMGVRGCRLVGTDKPIALATVVKSGYLLTVTKEGMAKRSPVDDFAVKRRGGKGMKCVSLKNDDCLVFASVIGEVEEEASLFLITNRSAAIRVPFDSVRETGRVTKGVMLKKMDDGEEIVGAAVEF